VEKQPQTGGERCLVPSLSLALGKNPCDLALNAL
jgi:hypothetical protein